jgi:hypothetical protein
VELERPGEAHLRDRDHNIVRRIVWVLFLHFVRLFLSLAESGLVYLLHLTSPNKVDQYHAVDDGDDCRGDVPEHLHRILEFCIF